MSTVGCRKRVREVTTVSTSCLLGTSSAVVRACRRSRCCLYRRTAPRPSSCLWKKVQEFLTQGPARPVIKVTFQIILVIYWSHTLSDKISADKIFGRQNFSADKIFGTNSNFRQFCPPKMFYPFYVLTRV